VEGVTLEFVELASLPVGRILGPRHPHVLDAKLPPAEASWSWVNMIFGGGVSLAAGMSPQRQAMLALELTQMAQQVAAVDEAIDDPERAPSDILPVARHRYLEAAFDLGNPSKRLRLSRTQRYSM